jgi:protein SSD1
LGIHLQKLSLQQQKTSIIPNSLSVVFREAIVISVFDQFFDIIIPELNLERRIHLACLPVWRFDHSAQNGTLTMFWRKGVDTSTGKQGEWSLSDEEDDDEMDEDALLEEMNQGSDDASSPVQEDYKNPVATEDDSSIVSKLAVKEAINDPVVPKKTVSTPLARIPEPTRSTNRRASIVRARLSDSTAYSTEQGYQTIKALDKIRVVIITEMTRTPPTIRILAANPFS